MNPLIHLIGFGLLAATGNIIGGFLISGSRATSQRMLRYLIALGAGFMLAAVFLEVIPEVALQWQGSLIKPMGLTLAGYLLIQFVEHTIAPHFHFGEETHSDEMKSSCAPAETRLSKPRPSMVSAKVPCTSSQARTQREQTMHLAGSKVK